MNRCPKQKSSTGPGAPLLHTNRNFISSKTASARRWKCWRTWHAGFEPNHQPGNCLEIKVKRILPSTKRHMTNVRIQQKVSGLCNTYSTYIFQKIFQKKSLTQMRCGALVTTPCCGCSTLHMWWLWQPSPGGAGSCQWPPCLVSAPPAHTQSHVCCTFPSNPRHYGRGGWCWQPVSVRRSSQLSPTQAVHPESEARSTVISRGWTGELGLWVSFIVLTGPPLLWPRAVLGLSSKLELVLYLLKTGNLAPTCTYK